MLVILQVFKNLISNCFCFSSNFSLFFPCGECIHGEIQHGRQQAKTWITGNTPHLSATGRSNNPEPPTTEAWCLAPFLFLLVAWKPEEYLDRKQTRVAVWLHPCQINVAGPSPQSMLLDLWILDLHFTDLVSSKNWQQILVSKAVPWSLMVCSSAAPCPFSPGRFLLPVSKMDGRN